jgi:hypothetical protein
MHTKYLIAAIATAASITSAQAGEYMCKVYCNNGSTTVVIQANSASDAANKIDPQPVANQICRDAGKGNASTATMGSSQCSKK